MRDVTSLQNTILEKMGFEDSVTPDIACDIPLLTKILGCDSESIQLALGGFGERLKAFTHAVDLKHPHVKQLFEDMFAEDGSDFCQNVTELLDLAEFAREKKLTRVLSNMGGRVVGREKLCRAVIKTIDSPFNNRCRIRLLRTKDERDRVRAEKKIQTIDLTTVLKRGEEVWLSQPDNFSSFVRWETAYEDEIALATKKSQRYAKLGCTSMAKQVLSSIEQFKSQIHEAYYGFNRITMNSAAIVIAKFLGYKLKTYWTVVDGDKRLYSVIVPHSLFEGYKFEVEPLRECNYEPRVYPLHKLIHIASDSVKRIIDHLEAFPAVGGRAIFDNYAVVVPGIAYPLDKHSINDIHGNKLEYTNKEDARQALDMNLIEGRYVTPVLLGERDGKCFFISYFDAL